MSGTYQISVPNSAVLELFPKNPLTKRWDAQQVATRGQRSPIFSAVYNLEMSFGILETQGQHSFFESRYIAGGLYNAILPHPITGNLTGFTGVAILDYSAEFNDIDRDSYAEGARMGLSVNLFATGTV